MQEARTALHTFKQQLIARGEATELFARERENGFAAPLGNLEQSIFGAPAIPLAKAKRRTCFIIVSNRTDTVLARLAVLSVLSSARRLVSALFETTIFFREESPFADGNKRSGAFLFVDFLHRNRRLLRADGEPVINDIGLAALTLLVADNLPRHKKTRLSVSSCTCCNHKERSPSIATVAHEWASERCRGQ